MTEAKPVTPKERPKDYVFLRATRRPRRWRKNPTQVAILTKKAQTTKRKQQINYSVFGVFLIPGLRLLVWPVALSGHAVSANTIIAHCRRKTNLSKNAAIHDFQISYEAAIESHLRMRISYIEFLSDIVATVAFYACGSKLFVCSNVAQLCPRSLYYTRNGIKVYLGNKNHTGALVCCCRIAPIYIHRASGKGARAFAAS